MKKQFLITILVMLSSFLILGRAVKITNPVSKTVVSKGDQLNITWQKLTKMNGFVKIRLFNSSGSLKVLSISEKAANKGSFKWTYTGNVKDGNYRIRVKTIDNKDSGDSQIFRIETKSAPPPPPPPPPPDPEKEFLNLTYPNTSIELSKNFPIYITWDWEGIGNISIELWERGKKYGTITSSVSGSQKKLKWFVGTVIGKPQAPANKFYQVKLISKIQSDSGDKFFKITDKLTIVDDQINNMINNTHQLKENQIKLPTIPNPPKNTPKKSLPKAKILIFKADPPEIKNGQSYKLKYHYKNAKEFATIYTFKNGKKDKFYRHLPKGNDISGSIDMPAVSWNDDTYYLEVANYDSMYFSTTQVKVKKETKVSVFRSNKSLYNQGETVELHYGFLGAVKAFIKDMGTNKIVKNIDPQDQNIVNGVFKFPFKQNSVFKLFIKETLVNKLIESNPVRITDQKYYGIKRWKVVHNWRADGWHVDVNFRAFGLEYLKFFLFDSSIKKEKIVDEKKFPMYQEFTYNRTKVTVIPHADNKKVVFGAYYILKNGKSGYLYPDMEIK